MSHFYLSSPDSRPAAELARVHRLPNSFATQAEAHRVATELLKLTRYTVWYHTSTGRQRSMAVVDTRAAAVSL